MRKHIINLQPLGKTIQVNHQTPLIDVLHEFGIEFPCGGKGTCGKCKVKLIDGKIDITDVHQQQIEKLGLDSNWRLACYSICTSDITLEVAQFSHMILADESDFDFVPQQGFGIAVDLGTTTLVAQLIDLSTANVIAVETMLNPQTKFGADLISRIQTCIDGKATDMTRIIRFAIGSMIDLMLQRKKVEIQKIVIVGNTAMQLIFSGEDVSPLAMYPFEVADLGMKTFTPGALNWKIRVAKEIRFYPSIGSFVGSDILAGMVATGLAEKEHYTALIDLGTNGEIVVGNKERIVCASTAAGPAFEGTNISMGMRAVTGAISSLHLENKIIVTNVIGNVKPKGICGSALVDAIAIFRELNLISDFGDISSGDSEISVGGEVRVTRKDINEFQLAKAAIAAGLEILTYELSLQLSDIQEFYIAGGFGNYINIKHVSDIGMIELPENKIRKMGNTALIGAKIFLFSEIGTIEQILLKTKHINLESNPDFQNVFIDKMIF